MQISDLIFNVAVLFIMMVPGVILKLTKMVPDGFGKGLSNLVLYLAQPALIVNAYLSSEKSFSEIWENVLAVLALSLVAHVIFTVAALSLFKNAPEARQKMLRFATIFSNAAFMGIPLVQAIFETRPEVAIYATVYNVTFNLFLWTLGVHLCTRNKGQDMDGDGDSDITDELISAAKNVKKEGSFLKVLLHPVTLASAVGIILLVFGVNSVELEEAGLKIINKILGNLAGLVAPLSMVVIGLRIPDIRPGNTFREANTYVFLALRHLILPLLTLGVIKLLILVGISISYDPIIVTIIMAAAPAASSATMFAEKYNCDAAYVSTLVITSTLLSIGTMPLLIMLV